jgi:hypothetical protein
MILAQKSTFFLEEENNVEEEGVDYETIPNVDPIDPQSVTNVPKEEEIPFKEAPFGNGFCSREAFDSLNSSTYYFLYPGLFSGLILQETTHYPIQINSTRPTLYEVPNGGKVHIEYKEDKASSCELSNFMSYQPFSWDEGNVVVDVYQTIFSYVSYSFFIKRKSSYSDNPLDEIVDVSVFHHCLKDMSYTMVSASPCISFDPANLSQVDGFSKYEPGEDL